MTQGALAVQRAASFRPRHLRPIDPTQPVVDPIGALTARMEMLCERVDLLATYLEQCIADNGILATRCDLLAQAIDPLAIAMRTRQPHEVVPEPSAAQLAQLDAELLHARLSEPEPEPTPQSWWRCPKPKCGGGNKLNRQYCCFCGAPKP
jgi:hypothetical protein